MTNKQIPYIVGAAILLIGLLFYYLGGNGGKTNYNWEEHYLTESKDPYGTYIVRNLLESYYPGQRLEVMQDSIGERLDTGNYVYIGNEFWLDSLALNQLLRFVENGNRAFIACTYFPQDLLDSLYLGECDTYGEDSLDYYSAGDFTHQLSDSTVSLNFRHPKLIEPKGYELKYLFHRQPKEHNWAYVSGTYFCEAQSVFASLGLMNRGYTNFVSATYGKGEFLLHTTPLAFTNLPLLDKRGVKYASKVFSHLKPGTIYWDERLYENNDDQSAGNGNGIDKDGPLKYILSQPALAWAWYILLAMAVLYLIFRAKRRQRVIPVLEQNTNTSLEFIGTIGRLFFLQNNHRQLAAQKMRLFLIFVRERYRMPTKDLNEQFAKSLAVRSDVPEDVITKILYIHYNIDRSGTITEDLLVDFHRLMERFYKDCK